MPDLELCFNVPHFVKYTLLFLISIAFINSTIRLIQCDNKFEYDKSTGLMLFFSSLFLIISFAQILSNHLDLLHCVGCSFIIIYLFKTNNGGIHGVPFNLKGISSVSKQRNHRFN